MPAIQDIYLHTHEHWSEYEACETLVDVEDPSVRFGIGTVADLTRKQLLEIYKLKAKDLNAKDDEAGIKVIAGTARNMGIEVVG